MIVAETLFILVTKSIYNKILEKWPRQSTIGMIMRVVLGPAFIFGQSLMLLHLILASTEPKRLSFITGYSFGFLMILMGSLIIVEVLFFTFKFLSALRSSNVLESIFAGSKRTASQDRILIGITFVLSCISFCIAVKNSAFPEVAKVKIPIKGLPVSFNNTIIVQLSDLHIGVLNGKSALERVVSVANSLKPDIVAITGDTAEGGVNRIRQALNPLRKLRSKFGAYITTGIPLSNKMKFCVSINAIKALKFKLCYTKSSWGRACLG